MSLVLPCSGSIVPVSNMDLLKAMKENMEPIAIIGIGCRFPGAKTPEAFWQILRNGVDTITEVPSERWDIDTFYHPEAATPGKLYSRSGGFLEQVDQIGRAHV